MPAIECQDLSGSKIYLESCGVILKKSDLYQKKMQNQKPVDYV